MAVHELFSRIPVSQLLDVFNQDYCEVGPEFFGFTDIYRALAEIIPKHFTVIDLGCCYAAQAFYFEQHRFYYGVDIFTGKRFRTPNTIHFIKSIQRFLAEDLVGIDLDETFAICSYVPDWEAQQSVREAFPNVFVYYPSDKLKIGMAVSHTKPDTRIGHLICQ